VRVRLDRVIDGDPKVNGRKSERQPKVLRGMGAFKGKLGGTEALFVEKRAEIAREESVRSCLPR
jgi:hypothetical protein